MKNTLVINKFLVLKHNGEELQLPTKTGLTIKSPVPNVTNGYSSYRVNDFEETTGELILIQESGVFNAEHFEISKQVNSELLLSLNIKKISIIKKSLNKNLNYSPSTKNLNYSSNQNPSNRLPRNIKKLNSINNDLYTTNASQFIKEEFSLTINDIKFQDNYISFKRRIHLLTKSVHFEIYNSCLKKEFDSIKNYFEKALGTKRIEIQISVEVRMETILNKTATSIQISQITENLIQQVEDNIIHETVANNDKNNFEILEKIKPFLKMFNIDEAKKTNWLLNALLKKTKTKHYNHLRFLSNKHLSELVNLKITPKPVSFIFLIKENQNYFVVWESYNTEEATYIWKLEESEEKLLLASVEEIVDKIKWLRNNNKLPYIKEKPKNFIRLEHDYSGDDMGFKKWKKELEEFLLSE